MTELAFLGGTPACEVEITPDIICRLLQDQHPDLQHLSIQEVDAGWDNAMFRLGEDLAVRLPRRQVAAGLMEHEQMWLPQLAPQLSIFVPVPVRNGMPTDYYPWCWSVVPWIEGVSANQVSLAGGEAERLAGFLRSLHSIQSPALANAPHNPFRSVSLSSRADSVTARLQRLADKTDLITPAIYRTWQAALEAPASKTSHWIHGDLHPRNLLVNGDQISGVIDWGDVTAGDVATDLAAIWMLFDRVQDRERAIAHYGMSVIEQHRAKGWAILFAAILLETGLVDNPENAAIAAKILRQLQ